MENIAGTYYWLIACLFGIATCLQAVEIPDDLEGDARTKAYEAAAEQEFATWKSTGGFPPSFASHAMRADRPDLWQRVFTGDKQAETEIRVTGRVRTCTVTIRDMETGEESDITWKRLSQDRFEIWTPKLGKLFDSKGHKLTEAHQSNRGAFLPDGRWLTNLKDPDTDDSRLSAFSAKGKRLWSIKVNALISPNNDESGFGLNWAASNRTGTAWVIAVGSVREQNWVRLNPNGDWKDITDPWRECLPQLVGAQGAPRNADTECRSDDGKHRVLRSQMGRSGDLPAWPVFYFNGVECGIHDARKCSYGILPDAWAVFVEGYDDQLSNPSGEVVWFFSTNGTYRHWVKGKRIGTSLATGGLWVLSPDGYSVLIAKNYKIQTRRSFASVDGQALVPVELHDDIGLGIFRRGDQFVLGSWPNSSP